MEVLDAFNITSDGLPSTNFGKVLQTPQQVANIKVDCYVDWLKACFKIMYTQSFGAHQTGDP